MSVRNRLKNYWQRPRTVRDAIENRRVTFLELFYDLVFVVYISQITHSLAHGFGLEAVIMYVFAFLIGWWAWLNSSSYHELHGNDDVRSRVYTFIQMFFVIGMIIFSHDAFNGEITGFAISYAAFHIVVGLLWFMIGLQDKEHARISNPYSATMFTAAIIFIGSIFAPIGVAYLLWGITILVEIFMPVVIEMLLSKSDISEEYRTNVTHSMSERFGLFTIIVIGEMIVGIVAGFSHIHHIEFSHILAGIFWFVIAVLIWWNYFDFISLRLPKEDRISTVGFTLMHLPIAILISLVGVMAHVMVELIAEGENNLILYSESHFFIGTLLIFIGLLGLTLKNDPNHPIVHKRGVNVMILSGVVLVFVSMLTLPVWISLSVIIVCLLGPLLFVFSTLVFGKGAR